MKKLTVNQKVLLSLCFNFTYALSNCAVGLTTRSWWFVTLGLYYVILSISRFSVLQVKRKSNGDLSLEGFAEKITGILLILLSFCLIGIIILSAVKDRGKAYHEIIMIAIAAYTFSKITLAIIGMVKAKSRHSSAEKTLRNISFADAFVSVYSLQRSMLVNFPGMAENEILLFNILTGAGVWILVLLLGINLLGGRKINMAKSKIVKTRVSSET